MTKETWNSLSVPWNYPTPSSPLKSYPSFSWGATWTFLFSVLVPLYIDLINLCLLPDLSRDDLFWVPSWEITRTQAASNTIYLCSEKFKKSKGTNHYEKPDQQSLRAVVRQINQDENWQKGIAPLAWPLTGHNRAQNRGRRWEVSRTPWYRSPVNCGTKTHWWSPDSCYN